MSTAGHCFIAQSASHYVKRVEEKEGIKCPLLITFWKPYIIHIKGVPKHVSLRDVPITFMKLYIIHIKGVPKHVPLQDG